MVSRGRHKVGRGRNKFGRGRKGQVEVENDQVGPGRDRKYPPFPIPVCQSPLPHSIWQGKFKRVLWKEKSHSVTECHTDMKTILYIKR